MYATVWFQTGMQNCYTKSILTVNTFHAVKALKKSLSFSFKATKDDPSPLKQF